MSKQYRVKAPDVVYETIEGETVIVHLGTGNYYSLQGVGADIWVLIDAGAEEKKIVEEISQRYRVEPENIQSEVAEFVTTLVAENLIEQQSSDRPPNSELPELQPADSFPEYQPPAIEMHNDMQELLLIDPVHEVSADGWPNADPERR